MAKTQSSPKKKGKAVKAEGGSSGDGDVVSVKVKVHKAQAGDDPVVVSFPRGVPASILDAEEDAAASGRKRSVQFAGGAAAQDADSRAHDVPTFTWSKLKAGSNRGKSIQGSDRTCTYSASNEGRGYDGRLAKLYVAVYDKEKHTLTLQPAAERGQVFALDQSVKSYEPQVLHSDATIKNMSASERRMLLFESFGSAKKQRALKSQAANVVNIDSVISAGSTMLSAVQSQDGLSESNRRAMEDAAAGRTRVRFFLRSCRSQLTCRYATITRTYKYMFTFYSITQIDPAQAALAAARRAFLPPFDETAQEPHKVFSARAIAEDDLWGNVSRVTDAVTKKEGDWRDNLTGRGFWFKSIKKLLNGIHLEDNRSASTQIKTAILLNGMMKFHQNATKSFFYGTPEELAKKFAISNDMAPRFLELFAVESNDRGKDGYSITKPLKDKRLIHLLILYLLAHGRDMKTSSIDMFCDDLQLEVSTASMLLREAACNVNKTKGGTSVSLKAPINFPPPRRGKRP